MTSVANFILSASASRKMPFSYSSISSSLRYPYPHISFIKTCPKRSNYPRPLLLAFLSQETKRRLASGNKKYSTGTIHLIKPCHDEKDLIGEGRSQSQPFISNYWNTNLNSPKHTMAPMVAQSDLPFRILCRTYDTNLCYTQMIHSYNFLQSEIFQKNHLDVYPDTESSTIINNTDDEQSHRSKLHMSESGWNILDGFDWDKFEKDCTFLQSSPCQSHQRKYNDFDQDEIRNMIQICRKDHEDYLKYCSVENCLADDDDEHIDYKLHDNPTQNLNKFQEYGIYYEGLPMKQNSNHDDAKNKHNDHPLVVQLAGHDPQIVSQAAKTVLALTNTSCKDSDEYNGPVAGIDINCGCPQAIAKKGNYGAFLMEKDFESVRRIIETLKKELPPNVGVSVKIRIPPEYSTCEGSNSGYKILKQRITEMMDAGVDLITVHGRTLHENKTKVRHCNWDAISDARGIIQEYYQMQENVEKKRLIPIIANGGIENYNDIVQCLDQTKANGVMSSEALLENPGLFMALKGEKGNQKPLSSEQTFEQQIRYSHEYLDLCVLFPPLPGSLGKKGGSFNVIRSHLFKFLYRYLEEQTDLRSILAEPKKMTTIQSARDLLYELERRYNNINDNDASLPSSSWNDLKSSKLNSSWYRRHRDAIASNKMKIRGAKGDDMSSMTVEEKKIAMRDRIRKLKAQKDEKKKLLRDEKSNSSVAA